MYQCSSCGAGLAFDPESQMLKCPYCGEKTNPKEAKNFKSVKDEKAYETKNEKKYTVIVHRCTQCGAELLSTDETVTTFCSYCGSSATLESKVTEEAKPDYIIPFKKTKEECEKVYRKMIKRAFFAPKDMIETQQIEKLRGIYMPYYVYSFQKHDDQDDKGKRYNRRVGDYVYYDDYKIYTHIDSEYSGITHDASANFSDKLSEAIAPYNIKEKEEFSPAYLSGFYADCEDVEGDVEYVNKANEMANMHASNKLQRDTVYVKYNSYASVYLNLKEKNKALFPVYFLCTRNKQGDRVSYAVINGQTGKIAAEIPIDFKKYLISSLVLAIPIFILLNLFITMTPVKVMIISLFFGIISLILLNSQLNDIYKRENNLDDFGYYSKNKTKSKDKMKFKDKMKTLIKPIISILIAITIFIVNPVSDVYYYLAALASIVLVTWSFLDIVLQHNLLTTRKLPQLQKRGGDENA